MRIIETVTIQLIEVERENGKDLAIGVKWAEGKRWSEILGLIEMAKISITSNILNAMQAEKPKAIKPKRKAAKG